MTDLSLPVSVLSQPDFFQVLMDQKLFPLLCPGCSTSFHPSAKDPLTQRLTSVMNGDLSQVRVRGEGCALCSSTHPGIIGRTACAEVISVTDEIRSSIAQGDLLSIHQSRREAPIDPLGASCGPTLRSYALWKMAHGMIDLMDVENLIGPLDIS